jgi:ankyrin repeat protein
VDLNPLPFDSPLEQYQGQASDLLEAHRSGDSDAIRLIHQKHPRFLDSQTPRLPKNLTDAEVRGAEFNIADAQLTIARHYDFLSWETLAEYVEEVSRVGSAVFQFESAVEAVVGGDVKGLGALLWRNPDLIQARSTRITHFDPPVHRATLLHYVAANGVEGYRQKTPGNAVAVARTLLEAGAEVDALADVYGGQYTTMSLLVSSCHPANAGVQEALVETLVDFGAAVEPRGSAKWGSPLMTALAFGYSRTAETLVRRGARVDHVAAAAGLGRVSDVLRLLAGADAESRQRALALAAQHGHVEVVRLLLDAGEDPNRYNPEGNHAHSTPLHQAALAGHGEVVRLLVERGARLDLKDTIYRGTPLDWAVHGGQTAVAEYVRARLAGAGE